MSFASLRFIALLCATAVLYFVLPRRVRWLVLLAASSWFYISFGTRAVPYLCTTALTAWAAALWLQKQNAAIKAQCAAPELDREGRQRLRAAGTTRKKRFCALVLTFDFGIWVVLKYSSFAVSVVNSLSARQLPLPRFVLPLGISFYTFLAMGYVIDVYRGKYPAERNPLKLLLFLGYFPHIVQGPFSRYDLLGKTLFEPHSFDWDRLCAGCGRILWGFFKKLLVADKIGVAVAAVFADGEPYGGVFVLLAALFYGIQIYADFSGYMDIVCGFSHILGIELAENFNQPYFSRSVEEFWRRWHITLGRWFRDYLFYPVSTGKIAQNLGRKCRKRFGPRMGKLVPSYLALIFVWTITGLWHGASWTFLVWGWLNLLTIVAGMQLAPVYQKGISALHINAESRGWHAFQMVRTFVVVCLFRFFSRADSMGQALALYAGLVRRWAVSFGDIAGVADLFPGMIQRDILVFLVALVPLIAVDFLRENEKWEQVKLKTPLPVRSIVFVAMLYGIILFSGGDNDIMKGFLYAQF